MSFGPETYILKCTHQGQIFIAALHVVAKTTILNVHKGRND